ncbi:hypothetical protein BASA81_006884 [Batrachochytrium salamandrivorans]|nr:hypothetical protein BASA81_006884 [Batrachochytrium salamandrivorans]
MPTPLVGSRNFIWDPRLQSPHASAAETVSALRLNVLNSHSTTVFPSTSVLAILVRARRCFFSPVSSRFWVYRNQSPGPVPEEMRSDLPGSTPTTRLEDPVGATYNSALFALGSGLTRLRWNTMELEEFLLEEQRGRLASSRFLVLALPAKHVHDAHYEVFGDYSRSGKKARCRFSTDKPHFSNGIPSPGTRALADPVLSQASKGKTGAVFDLVLLSDDISNDAIVNTLKEHFGAQEMYTFIGSVLISVNPYTSISNLYSAQTLNKYVGKKMYENPPHVFAVAEKAYRSMVLNHSTEAVVITGESGSGKTENSKHVLGYIAGLSSNQKSSNAVQRIKSQLLESNPMLEAFGNAKTVRNDNSSRFGKYMSILFKYGDPTGGKITVYLLEKARVVSQLDTERNFHSFYQLLAGAGSDVKSKLQLQGAGDYRYTKGCVSVKHMNDSQEFQETCKAMEVCGIQGEDQSNVWRVVAAVLHMGNLEFQDAGKQSSKVKSGTSTLNNCAQQLGVSVSDLELCLTKRTITTGTESVQKLLDVENAAHARDALAKSLYGKLFLWLVLRANETMHTTEFVSSIGVLDIFGFEILQSNGFEQLCINYTNEKLHQLFVEQTLKGEQLVYNAEGIPWEKVDYVDNTQFIGMIEATRGGMFALINEESIFPQGTDQSLFSKLKNNVKSKDFAVVKQGNNKFELKHYAGPVVYDTLGMLDKNKDLLYPEMIKALAGSSNAVAKQLFQDEAALAAQKTTGGNKLGGGANKRPDTTCVQYKSMVSVLMDDLLKTSLHYIRCIKPNEVKSSGVFDDKQVLTQTLYLGLLENLKVRRAGYAFRMEYDRFLAKYKSTSGVHEYTKNAREGSANLLKNAGISDYQLGKTMVFIKSPKSIFELEDRKKRFLAEAATYLPVGDGLIAADKVFGLNHTFDKSPLMFVVAGEGFYLFNLKGSTGDGGPAAHYFPMDQIDKLSYNPDLGWVAIHTKPYPGKFDTDPTVQLTYYCENCYGQEVEDWVEILNTSMGKEFTLVKSNGPAQMDGQKYKEDFSKIGDGAVKAAKRGVGNLGAGKAGSGGGGCCTVS